MLIIYDTFQNLSVTKQINWVNTTIINYEGSE